MFNDNARRGRDYSRGNTRGRSCSVSVLCTYEMLINVIKAVGRGVDQLKTVPRSPSVSYILLVFIVSNIS